MPSITLNESNPSLGSTVTFTVDTTKIPKSVKNLRVEVEAFQNDDLVYGEAGSLAQATADGTDPLGYGGFLLGGGGSVWLANGGPAHCKATLFYFGKEKGNQTFVPLATTEFEAAG